VTNATADPLVNQVLAQGVDQEGDLVSATDEESTDILHNPALKISGSGPATATVGQRVGFTFTVSHAPSSDDSPVSNLAVSDTLAGAATRQAGGDMNGNSTLDGGEVWTYTTGYTVKSTDSNPLVNVGMVQGRDTDGDLIMASDMISISVSGVATNTTLYFPIIVKN
jgi:hypothetical protein